MSATSAASAPIATAAAALNDAGIPFMVAGSFASSVHGLPRTTQDLDLVIDPPDLASVERLVGAFAATHHYVDAGAAREAYRRRTMFNVIDPRTGWKVDLIVKKTRPFSVSEFQRRYLTTMLGIPVSIATAEDTIVAKLEWSKASGGSERQRRDIGGILAMNDAALDMGYIERWVRELGLEAEWRIAAAWEP